MARRVLSPIDGFVVGSLCVVAVVAWGSGQAGLAAAQESEVKESCSVPDVTGKLQAALCSGDARRIREAIFHIDTAPGRLNRLERKRMLAALRRVYAHDEHFGSNLPWAKLSMPGAKAALMDPLAQAVRNHEIDMPLAELRGVAKEIVAAEGNADQFEGVRLLGLTDDAASVPLLRQIVMSDDPPVRRHHAIEALGYICDSAAKAALEDLGRNLGAIEPDATIIHGALRIREGLESTWCRKSTEEK